jgi:Glycosyltransferase family 87
MSLNPSGQNFIPTSSSAAAAISEHNFNGHDASRNAGGIRVDAALLCFLALCLIVFVAVHQHLESRFDFGVFYFAANMVLDGSRHALYDIAAQREFQALFHRPPETLFRNPPIALVPIVVLARLPMIVAYSIWTAMSLALLVLSLKILEGETRIRLGNWPILASLAYAPVMACLLHGQFSLLVLASYAMCYAQWRRGRLFPGGVILAIATIKFQLVLGFVAVLVLKRKWRELCGFATGSAMLLAASIAITGVHSLLSYPRFVMHSDTPIAESPNMANWQGFLWLFGEGRLWLIVLSVITVLWAARSWTNLDRGFCAAMLAAMLVSYHLTVQDLSLMLVPFYLCAKAGVRLPEWRVPWIAAFSVLGTTMMACFKLPLALLAVPTCLVLWLVGLDLHWRRYFLVDKGGQVSSKSLAALRRAWARSYLADEID